MSSPYQPYQPYTDATLATPSAGSRIAAILAHLSAPIAALLSAGSLSLLGPLLVWLVKKNDPYARRAAAESSTSRATPFPCPGRTLSALLRRRIRSLLGPRARTRFDRTPAAR